MKAGVGTLVSMATVSVMVSSTPAPNSTAGEDKSYLTVSEAARVAQAKAT